MRFCKICVSKYYARGMCRLHYGRWYKKNYLDKGRTIADNDFNFEDIRKSALEEKKWFENLKMAFPES